jgi:hypothetical protein
LRNEHEADREAFGHYIRHWPFAGGDRLAFRLWDNGRVRVHGAEQAVEMARAEAGPRIASLPVRLEAEQDFWTVRFGPDEKGQMHNYLVTIWDQRAAPLVAEITTEVAIARPR